MPAFDRFITRICASLFHPDKAARRRWKGAEAGTRLARRELREALQKIEQLEQDLASNDRARVELEQELEVTRRDLAQRVGAAEVHEQQAELQTAIIQKYQLKEEAEAANYAARKALSTDRALKRQDI